MFKKAGPSTLGAYVKGGYALLRDIKPDTIRQYQITADLFERWAGGPVPLDQLDEASVSAWLRDYAAGGVKPHTVRSKKNQVLALWRAASDDGLCDEPSARRVRRVRCPEQVVDAWTKAEVEQLLRTAATLPRPHRCGLSRAAWFDLAIRVAWDSGLRWGDLIALRVDSVQPDGTTVVQSKTGKAVTFTLSPTTLEALAATLATCPRRLVCPWPASHETFNDQVRTLVAKSGIRAGTWKWIRRGSGTDVEAQADGTGHLHLGNTRGVFEQSYLSPAILGRRTPAPRELLVEALARQDRKKTGGAFEEGAAW